MAGPGDGSLHASHRQLLLAKAVVSCLTIWNQRVNGILDVEVVGVEGVGSLLRQKVPRDVRRDGLAHRRSHGGRCSEACCLQRAPTPRVVELAQQLPSVSSGAVDADREADRNWCGLSLVAHAFSDSTLSDLGWAAYDIASQSNKSAGLRRCR